MFRVDNSQMFRGVLDLMFLSTQSETECLGVLSSTLV